MCFPPRKSVKLFTASPVHSAWYKIDSNFCVFGGHKSDFDGHSKHSTNNLHIFASVYGVCCLACICAYVCVCVSTFRFATNALDVCDVVSHRKGVWAFPRKSCQQPASPRCARLCGMNRRVCRSVCVAAQVYSNNTCVLASANDPCVSLGQSSNPADFPNATQFHTQASLPPISSSSIPCTSLIVAPLCVPFIAGDAVQQHVLRAWWDLSCGWEPLSFVHRTARTGLRVRTCVNRLG